MLFYHRKGAWPANYVSCHWMPCPCCDPCSVCQYLVECRSAEQPFPGSLLECLPEARQHGEKLIKLEMVLLSRLSRPTLRNPMDYSPWGSSVHGILQARVLEWVCHALLQGIFLTQGSNPVSCLLYCQLGSPALAPPRQLHPTAFSPAISTSDHWKDGMRHHRKDVVPVRVVLILPSRTFREIWRTYMSKTERIWL